MQSKNLHLPELYHDLIVVIITSMELRDLYTANHSQRVANMTEEICKVIGVDEYETENIHLAAHVHDIGKIGIADNILSKKSRLNNDEWEEMKRHSLYGYSIIGRVPSLNCIAKIVKHHHERWDGNGYPDNLSGETIPIGSRIIAVADSIDAMLTDRSYRKAIPVNVCKREIEKNIGIMYDPFIATKVIENWDNIIEKQRNIFITPYI